MKAPIDSAAAGVGATVALLNGGADFAMLDLWKITLNGGLVVRWHGGPMTTPIGFTAAAGQPTAANGTYAAGPVIDRGKISTKLGLEVATLDMKIGANSTQILAGVASGATCTIEMPSTAGFTPGGPIAISGCAPAAYNGAFTVGSLTPTSITYTAGGAPGGPMTSFGVASALDQINGAPLVPYAQGRGFDGAAVVLYRAFLANWASQITGLVIAFSGRVTEIKDMSRAGFTMTVSAWTVLLNVNMGPDVFQAGCLNTHYDADCGLARITSGGLIASPPQNQWNGAVAASPAPTGLAFQLAGDAGGMADHYFDKGTITFTSGPNNGLARTVQTYVAGLATFAFGFPNAPAAADTFVASRGCLLTLADCEAQRPTSDAESHFRGQPFTPPAVQAIA